MRSFLFLSLIIFLVSCNSNSETNEVHPLDKPQAEVKIESTQKVTLFELSWIQGEWIDTTSFPGHKIIEIWKLSNDTLIGNRGTIKGVDTNYSQLSKIFINNNSPVYLLEQEGSAFVSFKTKSYSNGSITFGNIANLAPTEIQYSKNGLNLDLSFTIITPAGPRIAKHSFQPIK